ncbi:transposase mutator type [Intestinibacter bartlettii CAG:1329]|uniref:Mutator family transposase n=1 Tax=Intestinibacter bartlettii CAG:1329 TaxID=1263063 RepID=R5X0V2_9FIRM|nr:transposase mutator type [Intestinibacter bartlettii CAG:1329]
MPGRSIFYEKLKQRINNTNNSRWRISNSKRYRRLSKGYVQRCNTRNVRKGAIALELGYEKGDSLNKNTENRRNGYSKKTVKSQFGNIELDIPRDRDNNYDPQVIPKHTRDISGLEEKIISLYARGMSTRDIHDQIKDLYGIEISAEYVSHITDVVIEHARLWQNRPLEPVYPFVFMDAIHYKVKEDSKIKNKAAYVILGVNKHGFKDVLIFSVDGLPGFKEAISASYPESDIQRCIIHQLRNTFKYVSYKDSKELMNDFKLVYEAEALSALDVVEEKWGKKYPTAIRIWRDNWDVISPFFSFPQEIRTIMYTTNIIEGVNRQFRKVTKTKSTFPSDESLLKILYLASQNIMKKWTVRYRDWDSIYNQLSIYFDNRI